jgi:rsbT co-antagonist protein RsbR
MSIQPAFPLSDDALPLPRLALESIPFPMNIYRSDGLAVAANTAALRLFRTPEGARSYNVFDDPSTAENDFRASFERARAGETVTVRPTQFDPSLAGEPGELIWHTTTIFPFSAPDGSISFIGAVYQDVSAQIRVEDERARLTAELAERVKAFQPFYALAENALDGFVLNSMDQRIFYANRALKTMTGHSELVGTSITNLLMVEERQLTETRQGLFSTGAWQGEVTYGHADGSTFPVQVSLLLIRDEAGRPLGVASIVRDLRAQRRAEEERVALQEQVIASQQAALRELSTPLIPLTDKVMVMPLVGAIDSERAQQIMEVLLEGIALHRAEVVLLDISGVRVVDTQVADALLRAARAVKLLGAQVILTGISAEIAQTIVHLGADMSQISTQADLQAGLRYALARYGEKLRIRNIHD